MTYKQIEQAREIRLWIGQILVPLATTTVALLSVPEVRQAVAVKATSMKESIERKFRKD